MSFNSNDQFHQLEHFFQSWEDQVKSLNETVRRMKAAGGTPVANLGQLDAANPQDGEARFVKKVFDRFSPGFKKTHTPRK